MELVEVLGCFTGQILKFSNWTQIPTNHLNLKNYCFTLTDNCQYYTYYYCLPSSYFCEEWSYACRFFYEFSVLLELLVFSPANLFLNGDFNFHVNDPSDSTSSQFLDLLNCFNLDICNLCTPKHKNNNVLDLIIIRSGETSVPIKFIGSRSCHFWSLCSSLQPGYHHIGQNAWTSLIIHSHRSGKFECERPLNSPELEEKEPKLVE